MGCRIDLPRSSITPIHRRGTKPLTLEQIVVSKAQISLMVFRSLNIGNLKPRCLIDLLPRGAPWATYIHTAKKSINRQFTSNYHDHPTVCHIRPLPQYSPYLFSTFVSVSFSLTSVNHSSVPPLDDFWDFDASPLCEARGQLKGQ
nr:hypothetical transcript [Hymenolepis microstoma]